MALVYEFERRFREVEGIRLIIRTQRNEPVNDYSKVKKMSGSSTVSRLRERVRADLGHDNFELLDENMNELHGLRKLKNVREAQERTLPE